MTHQRRSSRHPLPQHTVGLPPAPLPSSAEGGTGREGPSAPEPEVPPPPGQVRRSPGLLPSAPADPARPGRVALPGVRSLSPVPRPRRTVLSLTLTHAHTDTLTVSDTRTHSRGLAPSHALVAASRGHRAPTRLPRPRPRRPLTASSPRAGASLRAAGRGRGPSISAGRAGTGPGPADSQRGRSAQASSRRRPQGPPGSGVQGGTRRSASWDCRLGAPPPPLPGFLSPRLPPAPHAEAAGRTAQALLARRGGGPPPTRSQPRGRPHGCSLGPHGLCDVTSPALKVHPPPSAAAAPSTRSHSPGPSSAPQSRHRGLPNLGRSCHRFAVWNVPPGRKPLRCFVPLLSGIGAVQGLQTLAPLTHFSVF